jgi:hypothetical protein
MKVYTKLKLPHDSAFGRKTWRRFFHWRIVYFVEGIKNLLSWIPTIYKDKNWDDYYIFKVLQKKIEMQRAYLVNANRHTRIDEDNYWMTVVLNLIERQKECYYETEMYDYLDSEIKFVPTHHGKDQYEMVKETKREDLDNYLKKYPSAVRAVKRLNKKTNLSDKETLAFHVGKYNHDRCKNLIFEILKTKIECWWD